MTKSCLKIVDSRPTQVILEIGRKKRVVFFGFDDSDFMFRLGSVRKPTNETEHPSSRSEQDLDAL